MTEAQYAGTCPECGGRYAVGDQIQSVKGARFPQAGWMHAVCPKPDDPLAHTHPVCPKCFVSHPQGDDCW